MRRRRRRDFPGVLLVLSFWWFYPEAILLYLTYCAAGLLICGIVLLQEYLWPTPPEAPWSEWPRYTHHPKFTPAPTLGEQMKLELR
jgi:hypothetical protein